MKHAATLARARIKQAMLESLRVRDEASGEAGDETGGDAVRDTRQNAPRDESRDKGNDTIRDARDDTGCGASFYGEFDDPFNEPEVGNDAVNRMINDELLDAASGVWEHDAGIDLTIRTLYPNTGPYFVIDTLPGQSEWTHWVLLNDTDMTQIDLPYTRRPDEPGTEFQTRSVLDYRCERHGREVRDRLDMALEILAELNVKAARERDRIGSGADTIDEA